MRQRPGDQEPPIVNDGPRIHDLVVEDVQARKALGVSRYGTALQPFNGRNAMRDLYEELLDASAYARQELHERDHIVRTMIAVRKTLRELHDRGEHGHISMSTWTRASLMECIKLLSSAIRPQ